MKMSPLLHRRIRLQNFIAVITLLMIFAGAAWLSLQYSWQVDVTRNSGNTLSPASQKLLATLPEPVRITAYVKKGLPIRLQITQLIDRYIRQKRDIKFKFVDPESVPEKARELNIGAEGLVIVEYQGRVEKLNFIDESSLTNALLQLAKAEERWVTFLAGHGERSPAGEANFDFGRFGKELTRRKIRAQSINLTTIQAIPNNSALLVLSAPTVPMLPGEIDIIKKYLDKGGNLFLLSEPGNVALNPLLNVLGLKQLAGTLVDATTNLYKITDPTFIIASEYIRHPITRDFQVISLFPSTTGFEIDDKSEFLSVPLLNSSARSWTEVQPLTGKIRFDPNSSERQGPITFAYALTRTVKDAEQRIVVVGDGDFLANSYIDNVGNLDLGLRIVNWLVHDDRFIDIPAKSAPDRSLQLTETSVAVIGFGFLIVLPLLLVMAGFLIWHKRRKR